MRRIIALTILCLAGTLAYAGPITPGKAMQVAEKVFNSCTPATKASGIKIIWDGEFEPSTKAGQEAPAFYVVSRNEGGFVIIAGNDNVEPVLGLSLENPFQVEGMPCNVKAFMEELKAYCRSGKEATPEIRERWAALLETKATADPINDGLTNEYLGSRTNLWNQTNPANYYCPYFSGQEYTSVCGCVPLAVAEVMAWYGTDNIEAASGTVPGYSYTGGSVPEHDLGTAYDWAGMHTLAADDPYEFYGQVNELNWNGDYYFYIYGGSTFGNTLTDVGYSVAHLVYDIGTLLQANYSWDGTSSAPAWISRNVGPVFGYSNTARYQYMDDYPSEMWEEMMLAEVARRPVIYSGAYYYYDKNNNLKRSGHSYVADGYATYMGLLMFHFNLGWGGSSNGYYLLPHQDDFDTEHAALFDFFPDPESSEAVAILQYLADGGLVYSSGFNTNKLRYSISMLQNCGSANFSGYLCPRIIDAEGNVLGDATSYSVSLGAGYHWTELGTLASTWSNPVLGDRVTLYYKLSSVDDYRLAGYNPYSAGLTSLPFFPAAFVKTKSEGYHAGDYFVFELVNNNYLYRESQWFITAPDGTVSTYDMDDYRVLLEEPGEYRIEVYTPDVENVVAYITVAP